jgi:glucosamine kinase
MTVANNDMLYLGIDGGGSTCRARLTSAAGEVIGTGVGGPANPVHGLQQAQASIMAATELALAAAGLPLTARSKLVAGLGLAGVNLPSVYQAVSQWQHPFHAMYLTTDLHIASLGAHGGGDGAALIAGTGSCGCVVAGERITVYGGHGFLWGDKGSGAWLGLEAVKAVLLAADGLGRQTQLTALLGEHLQAEGVMIVDRLAAAKASDYAQLAQCVFRAAAAGDALATNLLCDGGQYLSALANKLWEQEPKRMSFIGGLAGPMMPWLHPEVAARLSDPVDLPEGGAIYFARQRFSSR